MALDLNSLNLEAALQAKIDALDSNSDLNDILRLERAARLFNVKSYYDSAGELPNEPVLDGSLFAVKNENSTYSGNALYLNKSGTWEELQSLNEPTDGLYFQGTNYGYMVVSDASAPTSSLLERFSFASSANSTSLGTIGGTPGPDFGTPVPTGKTRVGGGLSDVASLNGYQTGGEPPGAPAGNIDINRFPMVSGSLVRITGELTAGRYSVTNQSDVRGSQGFTSGGREPPAGSPPFSNVIDKFSFTSETNAVDAGDISYRIFRAQGYTDTVNDYGYVSGGQTIVPETPFTTITRFPFSSPFTTSTDMGDLSPAIVLGVSGSSTTHGFVSGGDPGSTSAQKFPFATPFTTASNVGTIPTPRTQGTGVSSTEHMYVVGGFPVAGGGATMIAAIQRFPFANEPGTTEDVGDLSPEAQAQTPVNHNTGHQY